MESEHKALKSQIALRRCAKAAFLLYRLNLKSLHRDTTSNYYGDQEMWRREIRDLNIQLLKEHLKNKKVKLCASLELFLLLIFFLSLWTFFLLFLLKTR